MRRLKLYTKCVLVLAVLLSLFPPYLIQSVQLARAAGLNLLLNGDMEQGTTAPDSYSNWTDGTAANSKFVWDSSVFHTGSEGKSLKIINKQANSSHWYQTVQGWQAGKTYQVSGWIRTSQVDASGLEAMIGVDMTDGSGQVAEQQLSVPITGSKNWTKVSFQFSPGAGTQEVVFRMMLWGTKGTVWFDDVSINELKPLVANGGVENGTSAPDSYTNWSDGTADFQWDSSVSHTGGRSLEISQTSAIASLWQQILPTGWEVGKTYRISGWIKTSNISTGPHGALIGVEMRDSQGAVLAQVDTNGISGTNDWTKVSFTFTVQPGTEQILLMSRLWGASGIVWFDDFSGEEVLHGPATVKNAGAEQGTTAPASYSNWTNGSASFVWDSTVHRNGAKSLNISQAADAASVWIQPLQDWTVGRTYRLSGYIKTEDIDSSGLGALIGVEMLDSSGAKIGQADSESLYGLNDWTRVTVQFTVAQGTAQLNLMARLWGSHGSVWFDDFSIVDAEQAPMHIKNGTMESGAGGEASNYSTWTNGTPVFAWDSSEFHSGSRSLHITQLNKDASMWQQLMEGWEVGGTYEVSGWVKSSNVSSTGAYGAMIGVEMKDAAGNLLSQEDAPALTGTHDWTRLSFRFTVPQETAQVVLTARLWGESGSAWFDDLYSTMEPAPLWIMNGDMEEGFLSPDYYRTSTSGAANFSWDSSESHRLGEGSNGTRSLKLTQTIGSGVSTWFQKALNWRIGGTYKVGGWIKTTGLAGSAGSGAGIGVEVKDQAGTVINSSFTTGLLGSQSWTYVTGMITVPSGASEIDLVMQNANAAGTVWFDDIYMMEIVGGAIAEPVVSGTWWDTWPRVSYWGTSDPLKLVGVNANYSTVVGGLQDEGRGAYMREQFYQANEEVYKMMDVEGIKKGVWLEGLGEARAVIGAVNKTGPSTYEIDPATGAPKLIAHNWTWDTNGPGEDPNANEIVWMGLHSYANQESWQGSYVRPSGMSAPAYPDGSSATGYLSSGTNDPRQSKFFDALSAKGLNGDSVLLDLIGPSGTNKTGMLTIPLPNGSTTISGDIYFGKDMAAPWWNEYNIAAARYFIDRGADGFWVDNYSGWDFISNAPIKYAFGDWSENKFKDYLAVHPAVGVSNPSSFDIKAYLVDKFESSFPGVDPYALDNSTTMQKWSDPIWLEDTVWKAYKTFKSEIASQSAADLYDGIKQQAALAGKNPDDIYVGGNDVPRLNFAAADGAKLDMVNTEYSPDFSPVTQGSADGMPPYGHAGPLYSLATNYAKSKRAVVWYYISNPADQNKTVLGEVLHYEALANNTLLNQAAQFSTFAGTDESTRRAHRMIQSMTSEFGNRERAGKVGLVYSNESEYYNLAPGGFVNNGQVANALEYYGWGQALEDLNVPYQSIPDFKLTLADLADISVLILPHVKAISSDTVNDVLIPFVNNGGKLLVSGTDSGDTGARNDIYASHSSALLYDLTQSGQAQFIPGTPGKDFYASHLTLGTARTNALNTIDAIVQGLYSNGSLPQEIQLSGFGSNVLTTLNYDSGSQKMFVDFVNVNIDIVNDRLTYENGGTLTVKIPSSLQGIPLDVKFYNADKEGASQSLAYSIIDSQTISLTIPKFRVYGSLVISP